MAYLTKRPCWVEVSPGAFEENYRFLLQAANPAGVGTSCFVELLAMVKADAYGHGLAICAAAAMRAGAQWLGVTSVEEGVAARAVCPDAEILVIGGVFPDAGGQGQGAAVIEHRLTPVVWDAWQLDELEAAARAVNLGKRKLSVHLELDTGMSRQGVEIAEGAGEIPGNNVPGLERILQRFSGDGPLRLGGVMTHLYAADESDGMATEEQYERLRGALPKVLAFADKTSPLWLHVGNSAAVLSGSAPGELRKLCSEYGLRPMARPGLALYGLSPEFSPDEPARVVELRGGLKAVLEWKTRVVSVRPIDAGQPVGYNGTFVASEPMQLALLAVGYADGLKRGLSNRGWVLIGGARAPIVGRISMDQTVVDVTGIAGVAPGDEVVLLGRQGDDAISAEEHARWAGTIPWEIFTSIANRVERRVRADS